MEASFVVLPIHQRKGLSFLLLITRAYGKRDRELRPTFRTISGRHSSSVNSDNCLNESKPQSVAPRRASFYSSLEEVTTNLGIETRAVIFDGKGGDVIVRSNRDTDQA